ncbi:cell division protein SepF [Clostridia bacterium]|nr:cell division protein SepF [Clostridia bacterium]
MAGVLNKIMNFVGFDYDAEIEEEEFYEQQQRPATRESRPARNNYHQDDDYYAGNSSKRSKVVNINTTARLNVVIINPESFEEAQDIADHIKLKKPCVVNLENIEKDVARRIVDFLSGAVYAVDGNIQKVSNGIFLVAPYNVSIMGDFKDELRNKGVFPWN